MRNKLIKKSLLCGAITFLLFGCDKKEKDESNVPDIPKEQEEQEEQIPEERKILPITVSLPEDNSVIKLYDEKFDIYLNAVEEADIINAIETNTGCNAGALPVELKWNGNGSANYTVYMADNEQMDNAQQFLVSGLTPYLKLYNLIPNTQYYWKVKGNEKNDDSIVHTFKTANEHLRPIYASGGSNMRDLGGWTTSDGKMINYGLLYRGNCLNGYLDIATLTEDGIDTFVNQLGMNTEIDLRTPGADDLNQSSNWFNPDGKYLKASTGQYTQIFSETVANNIKKDVPSLEGLFGSNAGAPGAIKSIFETLADKNNYPVYMHCNIGADRTGTMAYLINGLLGVPYEQLVQDYEITSYCSKSGQRPRSQIANTSKGKIFEKKGFVPVSGNFIAFGALHNAMMKYYGDNGQLPLSKAIENYLLSYVGISKMTIAKIKNIMIKDYHDDTFDNVVELNDRQNIDLSSGTNSIDLGELTLDSVTKIELNSYLLGNDLTNLNVEGVTDTSGECEVLVYGVKNSENVVIKVPVNVVTEIITTMDRFKQVFKYTKNKPTFGYYILGSDIGSETDVFSEGNSSSYQECYGTGNGFNGVLDGCGYTISGKSSFGGLFACIGANAVIKNLNVKNYNYVSGYSYQHTTLGLSCYGTIENLNVELVNGPTSPVDVRDYHGFLITSYTEGFRGKNITVDAENFYLDTLFGGAPTKGYVFDSNKINGFNLTCADIGEYAHFGTQIYNPLDIKTLGGKLTIDCEENNTIDRNKSEGNIFLGQQFENDFTVTSITCAEVNCPEFTFNDGEITFPITDWITLGVDFVTFEIKLTNIYGLDLTMNTFIHLLNNN